MPSSIGTYLKFANLQIAAEAFLERFKESNSIPQNRDYIAALTEGNTHTSKFPPILADQFAKDWVVVDQRKNIQAVDGGTGFSGTLFRSREAGATGKFEYVISFRSTEFLDDAVRDHKSTNELEIKNHGWALGQIAEMEQWYADLKSSTALHPTPLLPDGHRFYVTGYSLGGHLATAFSILRREQGDLRRVIHTYAFNGAGTGTVRNGKSLTQIVDRFNAERVPGAIQFNTALVSVSLEQALAMAPVDERLDTLRLYLETVSPSSKELAVEAAELAAAIRRVRNIYAESLRVRNLGNGESTGQLLGTAGIQMDLRYQLALGRAVRDTSAEALFPQLVRTLRFERKLAPYPEQFANYTDLFGAGISAVSSSQIHYGTPQELYIEDQPLKRGNYLSAVLRQFGELLTDGYATNDFGDTHSLVLIVDALSVMDVLAKLDDKLNIESARSIIEAAGNRVGRSAWFSSNQDQGEAEGNTLENVVTALGELFGLAGLPGWRTLNPSTAGNTWYVMDDVGGFTGRASLHEDMQQIRRAIDAGGYAGNAQVVSLAGLSAAELKNRSSATSADGMAYRYALRQLNPVAILGVDYSIHNSAGELELYDGESENGVTEKWLIDRASLTAAFLKFNTENRRDKVVAGSIGYFDGSKKIEGQSLALRGDASSTLGVAFAAFEGGELKANLQSPPSTHVFGATANDVLKLSSTTDAYMEGGRGDDTITSASGKDEVWGGYGDDTIDTGSGDDTIYGGDGDDVIKGGEGDDLIYGDGKDPANLLITGDDEIDGGAGDDQIHASDGDNIVDGGAGDDRISAGDDDNIIGGGDGQDHIEVGDGANTIHGGAGDDVIEVGDGDNAVYGDDGGDTITLGNGHNLVVGGAGDDTIEVGDGGDVVWGDIENGDDALVGGSDSIVGGSGADQLHGGAGTDDLSAGEGNDLLVGGVGADILVGGEGADRLFGDREEEDDQFDSRGNDRLFGDAGNDKLYGGAGRDLLEGGSGDDLLDGGYGVGDFLIGGAGNDAYRIKSRHGNDVILDQDGIGAVSFDDSALSGGKNRGPGGIEWFDDPDNPTYRYTSKKAVSRRGAGASVELTVTNLKTGSAVFIDQFYNGDLGIELADGEKKNEKPPLPGMAEPSRPDTPPRNPGAANRGDPLVIDLTGAGLGAGATLGLAAGVHVNDKLSYNSGSPSL